MKATGEMAAAPVKNVDTSPERDKKGDDSLHDKRVEAGARVLRERLFPGVDLPLGDSAWVGHAREVLLAADAVVTEEQIAETILKALVFTSENSEAWADGLARDIAALFRGGAK